ncbi:MAG TPA: cytochrome c [Rhizomicrobium sp.]|nr:cytochrome c [Rhizomicrobium sp.]
MKIDLRSALIGAAALALFILIAAALAIALGIYNFGADAPHWHIVRSVIAYAVDRSVDARADDVAVPGNLNDPNRIANGASDYDAMCTGCHLAPGLKDNEMRPGLYPHPPELAKFPADDPAEQFWIVKHGIKMSAMPAWGKTHSDDEIWNMVAFLQKLPRLSAQQYQSLVKSAEGHHGHDGMDMGMGH